MERRCSSPCTSVEDGADQRSRQYSCLSAVQRGDGERVRVLMSEGVAVNRQDENGYSLFFHAIFRRHFAIAKELLAQGANIDLPDRHGWTPLFWAAFNGHAEIVKLLEAGSSSAKPPRISIDLLPDFHHGR